MIENLIGKVEKTFLGREGHGIPSFMIHFELSRSRFQGLGGYDLRHQSYNILIFDIMKVFDAESWEQITGKYCRIECREGLIKKIIHLINDDIFVDMDVYHTVKNTVKK